MPKIFLNIKYQNISLRRETKKITPMMNTYIQWAQPSTTKPYTTLTTVTPLAATSKDDFSVTVTPVTVTPVLDTLSTIDTRTTNTPNTILNITI